MTTASRQLEDLVLHLAWSQWTDLGVRGTVRSDQSWSIDLEALIVLTASVAELDPRLRDESLDWCLRNERDISRNRLRTLTRKMGAFDTSGATARYGSTLHRAGGRGWDELADPWSFERTSKSARTDLRHPNLVRLRLRAIFGVSARAEILHALAWQSPDWTSSARIAMLTGYTKRNTDDEVETLHRAGLVETTRERNRRLVRMASRPDFERFVGAVPSLFPDWPTIVRALLAVMEFRRRTATADVRVADVEASTLIGSFAEREDTASLPELPRLGEPYAGHRLEAWGIALLEGLLARA